MIRRTDWGCDLFHFRQRANVAQLAWAADARSAGAGGTEPASGALRRSGTRVFLIEHGFA
ncbi:hypothetical protein [Xenorhabdus vietnamensis]|uniref:hypothetical protein n=1 Tax=Xenorhabdus vietnamensis TaxID=351656 RepID=UPI00142E3675|nr:hypothetical protein [Xenorhabdus vietnamensis]